MHFESVCNSCGGAGRQSVSMVEFVEAAIEGLKSNSGAANKIMAIKAVRQLASDNHLPAGLRDCKEFVEALQTFEGQLREKISEATYPNIIRGLE